MKRTEIAPGVHLSYDPAQKFNRCRISIHFAFPARRETATAHALLPLVMERGYADCPDMTQMTKKLARLYGADILADDSPEKNPSFARSRAYEWLMAYASEYGFILRWPEDRQVATGMVYQPWHWRYVGVENARAIAASGLSLEEFSALEQAKA